MPKLCASCIQMTDRTKKILKGLIWVGGLSPLIGIFTLVFLAQMGENANRYGVRFNGERHPTADLQLLDPSN